MEIPFTLNLAERGPGLTVRSCEEYERAPPRWVGGTGREGGVGLRILDTETHTKPSSERIENTLFSILCSHLKGGAHDRPFKRDLTRV